MLSMATSAGGRPLRCSSLLAPTCPPCVELCRVPGVPLALAPAKGLSLISGGTASTPTVVAVQCPVIWPAAAMNPEAAVPSAAHIPARAATSPRARLMRPVAVVGPRSGCEVGPDIDAHDGQLAKLLSPRKEAVPWRPWVRCNPGGRGRAGEPHQAAPSTTTAIVQVAQGGALLSLRSSSMSPTHPNSSTTANTLNSGVR